MSNLSITGAITAIGPMKQVTETFSVREFAIKTPGEYPQEIKFQCVQDRCSILDRFAKGQEVEVFFDIRGRRSKENKIFNNLNAWKIDEVAAPQQQAQPQGVSSAPTTGEGKFHEPPVAANPIGSSQFADDSDLPF